MSLFKWGNFTSNAGLDLHWKIECDALDDDDWNCIAELIMKRYGYSEVHGVPTGGTKLAELLQPGTLRTPYNKNSLIVDDVYTTGRSIRDLREQLILRPDGGGRVYHGCVLFARMRINDADNWVTPLFQFDCYHR